MATGAISGSTDGTSVVLPGGGNNLVCISGTWQYPYYVLGTAAASAGASCSTYPAGALRYNTTLSNVEFCNGTTWSQVPAYSTSCSAPSGLSFTNVTSQPLSTIVTSNMATITFTGCSSAVAVSVSGAATAQISINGGAWATSGAISSGQTLQVRMTTSGSVSTVLTATVTVNATSTNWTTTTRGGSLMVFATPSTYVGWQLGGLSGADALCQSAAGAAGYAGTYKAILSSDTVSASSRLTLTYPIINAYNGATVAAINLWVGSITNTITTPSGGSPNDWTGSNVDGTIDTGNTCSSWSSSGGNAMMGVPWLTDNRWISWTLNGCTSTNGLMCIQQ